MHEIKGEAKFGIDRKVPIKKVKNFLWSIFESLEHVHKLSQCFATSGFRRDLVCCDVTLKYVTAFSQCLRS